MIAAPPQISDLWRQFVNINSVLGSPFKPILVAVLGLYGAIALTIVPAAA